MTETSTTTKAMATQAGITAHALTALANHILSHDLTGLNEVTIAKEHLELHISGSAARSWRASLGEGVDKIERERAVVTSALEFVTIHGRLPDSGVRVEVQYLRRALAVAR